MWKIVDVEVAGHWQWKLHIMQSDGLTPCLFFPHSLCLLLPPWDNKEKVWVWHVGTIPCPAHAAKFFVSKPYCNQSQTSWIASFLLQIGGNLRMPECGSRMEGVTLSNQIVWWLPQSSNLCAALHCQAEGRFLLDSCVARLTWNIPQVLSVQWCRHQVWPSPPSALHPQESLHSPRRQWSWPSLLMDNF